MKCDAVKQFYFSCSILINNWLLGIGTRTANYQYQKYFTLFHFVCVR